MMTAKESEAVKSIATSMRLAYEAAQELKRTALNLRMLGLNSDSADVLESMAEAILQKDRQYTEMLVNRQ